MSGLWGATRDGGLLMTLDEAIQYLTFTQIEVKEYKESVATLRKWRRFIGKAQQLAALHYQSEDEGIPLKDYEELDHLEWAFVDTYADAAGLE